MTFLLYGAGDARDHTTFAHLRREGATVSYAIQGEANSLLREQPGVASVSDIDEAVALAQSSGTTTVIVQRPELLLSGAVDVFAAAKFPTIGPGRVAAELEGSKLVCKRMLRDSGVPTPEWEEATSAETARRMLRERWVPGDCEWVIKSERYLSDAQLRTAVPDSLEAAEAAVERLAAVPLSERGETILVERRVTGQEVSVHAIIDGARVHVCPLVADYKRLHDGDRGPNTHGMGAVASTRDHATAWRSALAPLVEQVGAAVEAAGLGYRGVLYVGVMVTPSGPMVLECNVRPGNPEWQALLALMETPLSEVFAGLTNGGVRREPRWRKATMAGAVFAAVAGYPDLDTAPSDAPIQGIAEVPDDVVLVGEGVRGSQPPRAGTGRSLCVISTADNSDALRRRLYDGLKTVRFPGMQVRSDIGLDRDIVTEGGALPPDATPAAELPDSHVEFVLAAARDTDRDAARTRVAAVTRALIEHSGRGLELTEAPLENTDLRGFDLRRAVLNRARLHGARLDNANLTEAALICPGTERTRFTGARMRGAYMHAFAAQVCDFRRADLRDLVDATGALFHGCYLEGADLRGAMLSGSAFYQTALDDARLEGANLTACQVVESSCRHAIFAGAQLDDAVFTAVDLSGASLHAAIGRNVVIQRPSAASNLDLSDAQLPGLRLVNVKAYGLAAARVSAPESDVRDCHLPDADLRGADFTSSAWTRVQSPRAKLAGAVATGGRWIDCVLDGADLSGMKAENLSAVNVSAIAASLAAFQGRCAHLRNCDLSAVDLTGAYLYRAMLTGDPPPSMKLAGARLTSAVLVQAYVTADLTGADLANVRGAYSRFNQSIMTRANLSGAQLFEASLIKTDFRDARLVGISPPLLADRCAGLQEALAAAGTPEALKLAAQVADLERALHRSGSMST